MTATACFFWTILLIGVLHPCSPSSQRECVQDTKENSEKLIHARTGECYSFATRGPCGENMIFYRHPVNRKFGFCDCDQGVRSKYPCKNHPVRKMIYFPKQRRCFPIFSQGDCRPGFWLDYEQNSTKVSCQPNPCEADQLKYTPEFDWMKSGNKFWFYDPVRKSCFLSETRGYCPVGQTLVVTHDSHVPQCEKPKCHGQLTNFRSDLSCIPGSRYSYLWRGCVKFIRTFYYIG